MLALLLEGVDSPAGVAANLSLEAAEEGGLVAVL